MVIIVFQRSNGTYSWRTETQILPAESLPVSIVEVEDTFVEYPAVEDIIWFSEAFGPRDHEWCDLFKIEEVVE